MNNVSTPNLDRQALAGELVDHRQELQGPAFAGPLEHEVVRPHVVAIRRSEPETGPVIEPQPTALGMSGGHLQPLPLPDPLHSLVIHSPAVSRQQGRDPPVAIPPVFAGQRDDVGGQNRLIVCHPGRVSLGASHLSQHTARPTLGNGSAPGRRARPPDVDASGSEVSPGGLLQDREVQSLVGN